MFQLLQKGVSQVVKAECKDRDYSLTQSALTRLRIFSAMALVGFPIFSITGMLDILEQLSKPVEFVITLVLLLSFLPLTSDRIYNRLTRHRGKLDERERQATREAQVFSYHAIFVLFIASIIIGLSFVGLSELQLKSSSVSVGWIALTAMNVVFLMLFLPITYIAWTAKPLADED